MRFTWPLKVERLCCSDCSSGYRRAPEHTRAGLTGAGQQHAGAGHQGRQSTLEGDGFSAALGPVIATQASDTSAKSHHQALRRVSPATPARDGGGSPNESRPADPPPAAEPTPAITTPRQGQIQPQQHAVKHGERFLLPTQELAQPAPAAPHLGRASRSTNLLPILSTERGSRTGRRRPSCRT